MGFSLSVGLLSAMDTLCSQAYGAKNYVRVGHVFQRALAITFTFISPLMVLWYFADHALILAGQERSLAELAVKYTRYRIIQMPAYVGFEGQPIHMNSPHTLTQPFGGSYKPRKLFNRCCGLVFSHYHFM